MLPSERVQAATETGDVTMAAIQMQKILREEREQTEPEFYSRGGERGVEWICYDRQ